MRISTLSYILLIIHLAASPLGLAGQSNHAFSDSIRTRITLTGKILDSNENALPYVNIYRSNGVEGTISNEHGAFSWSFKPTEGRGDSVFFQSMGYKTQGFALPQSDTNIVLVLQEDLIQLNEMVIYAQTPSADDLIQRVQENIARNYPYQYQGSQFFYRSRTTMNLRKLDAQFDKSSLESIHAGLVDSIRDHFPDELMSFTDLVGKLYRSGNPNDSVRQKVVADKAVSLDDANLDFAFEVIETLNKQMEEASNNEYWRVKSGLYRKEISHSSAGDNPISDKMQEKQTQTLRNLRYSFKNEMAFADLSDEDRWEFIYHPRRYEFTIAGGTLIDGEEVYRIDFSPRRRGLYAGRIFVSSKSYAILKADFGLAPGKVGRDFWFPGIQYEEQALHLIIQFEAVGDHYRLKYLSNQSAEALQFDRKVKLQKVKDRFLFPKVLEEVAVRFDFDLFNEESVEILIVDRFPVESTVFRSLKENRSLNVQYVNQFSDADWEAYSIIEPTQAMKDYRRKE